MDTTKITFTSNNAYGTSVAQAVVEGNPYAPLVVESEAREQASIREKLTELVGELRVGKSLVFLGLVFTILLCAVTFGVVCFALEYSKETYVMEGALTDRATNQVVSTRVHEEVIENPLHADYAMGVQWITIMHSDGGMSRRRVNGYQRTKCIVQDENCNIDGYNYFFMTTTGPYAGTFKSHGLAFTPVSEEVVQKAQGNGIPQVGMLTGSARQTRA
eukprot:CAMPEP_0197865332 /NCGR_PEP_ID=MMETSP1438-20131217/43595_1 /TAXON_ID=1461541 /ORGANISM="Pterosperma sp., Strain CCMP1384" /LENGTH=216 /DNA_ID=CAMNT_0043483785 /DNA_START=787 /DNA_END=1437 /DNA_ORIENTATION=-